MYSVEHVENLYCYKLLSSPQDMGTMVIGIIQAGAVTRGQQLVVMPNKVCTCDVYVQVSVKSVCAFVYEFHCWFTHTDSSRGAVSDEE